VTAAVLTGGIATGKSTVAAMLLAQGIPVLDTDAVSASLSGAGGAAIPALRDAFGPQCLGADGGLDRARMREAAFSNVEVRCRLEGVLHPMIRSEVDQFLARMAGKRCVVAVPLFFESLHYRNGFEHVVVLDCSVQLQVERLVRLRQMSPDLAAQIIRAQAPRAIKLQLANRVISNQLGAVQLRVQVFDWLSEWP
jgi:dephospho-CoA kinase